MLEWSLSPVGPYVAGNKLCQNIWQKYTYGHLIGQISGMSEDKHVQLGSHTNGTKLEFKYSIASDSVSFNVPCLIAWFETYSDLKMPQ